VGPWDQIPDWLIGSASDRFNFKKALPSHGAHPCSSIHPAASYVIFRRMLKEEDEVKNGEEREAEENRA